jgi:hypothetical protein
LNQVDEFSEDRGKPKLSNLEVLKMRLRVCVERPERSNLVRADRVRGQGDRFRWRESGSEHQTEPDSAVLGASNGP